MRTLGPYTILELLGRGGQGVVYLAEDTRLGRKVALKLIEAVGEATPQERLDRFRREAEAASKLDHPNICAIHEAGNIDGTPFIAMRYVEGETLAQRIEKARREHDSGNDSTPSTRDEIHAVVLWIEKVARALHVAHEQGLIHRDIKPGNVMLTADGDPVILDFGLARDEFAGDLSLTHSGDLLGTPAYMSPEQLMAQRIPLDRRTDIYSLGATLHESLTLKRPFEALTRAELYQRIISDEPTKATSQNRAVPRDLQVVLDTAIDKNRDRRYQTALEFAEDLRRVRSFEPIHARPIGRLLRLKRWTQRHPARAAMLLGLILALALSSYFVFALQSGLRRSQALALANAAGLAAEENQLLALVLAREAVRKEPTQETLSRLYGAMASAHEQMRLDHPGPVLSLSAMKEGRSLLSACEDGKARIWNASSGETLQIFDHGSGLKLAASSPDEDRLVTAGESRIILWDRTSEQPIRRLEGHTSPVTAIEFRFDGKVLLSASANGTVRTWDLETGKSHIVLEEKDKGVRHAGFSADGELIVASIGVGEVRIVDGNGTMVGAPIDLGIQTLDVRFLSESHILTSSDDMVAREWKIDGSLVRSFRGHEGSVVKCSPSPSGERILTTSSDTSALVYDSTGQVLAELRGHKNIVTDGAFLDETGIATASSDGTVRIWDVNVRGFPVLFGHRQAINQACFDKTGRRLATSSRDRTVRIWDDTGRWLTTIGPLATLQIHILQDRDRLLTLAGNGRIETMNFTGTERITIQERVEGPNTYRTFAEQGDKVASSCESDAVLIHQIDGGRVLARLRHEMSTAVDWSPNGKLLLVGGRDGSVSCWNTSDFQELWRRPLHDMHVRAVCFDPESKRFVTACADGTARIFDLHGKRQQELVGHGGSVLWAEWSPRGDRILTTSRDKTARLWDPETGDLKLILRGHRGQVWRGSFSPTGDRVVTSSWDRTARIWPVNSEYVIDLADQRLQKASFSIKDLEPYRALLGDRMAELTKQFVQNQ